MIGTSQNYINRLFQVISIIMINYYISLIYLHSSLYLIFRFYKSVRRIHNIINVFFLVPLEVLLTLNIIIFKVADKNMRRFENRSDIIMNDEKHDLYASE
uniref:Uncharacterized protein n=1 Tax=Cacopsylla melanoneura TaxID=428564 RepID=A0A8D9BIT0_9HEMI